MSRSCPVTASTSILAGEKPTDANDRDEICRSYPDRWVLINELEMDPVSLEFHGGVVIGQGSHGDAIAAWRDGGSFALKHTRLGGPSQDLQRGEFFCGLYVSTLAEA